MEARSPLSSRCWQVWVLLSPPSLACRWLPCCCAHPLSVLSKPPFLLRVPVRSGPTLITPFFFYLHFLKSPFSKCWHIRRCWVVAVQPANLGKTQWSPWRAATFPAQCPARSKCSVNDRWMTEWRGTLQKLYAERKEQVLKQKYGDAVTATGPCREHSILLFKNSYITIQTMGL